MKYLSNRNQFLRESKFTGLQTYEKTPYSGEYFQINEDYGAGPATNDIGINDSLIGRFINHIIRKVKVAIGKMRIKSLTARLKSTFDELVYKGKLAAQDDEGKSQTARLVLYSFFAELVIAVDRGERVIILRQLTESALDALEKTSDFDEKESLKDELEAFLKFLEQFDDNDGELGEEDDEDEDDEDNEDEDSDSESSEEDNSEVVKKAYPMMITNLNAIITIINKVATMNIGKEKVKEDIKKHKTLPNETVNKIAQANNVAADLIWTKNANTKVDSQGTTLTQWLDKAQNNPANKTKKVVNGKETFINRDKSDIILPKDVLLLLEKDVFAGNRQVKDPKQLQQQQKVKAATKSGAIAGGQTAKEIEFADRHTREAFAILKGAVDTLGNKDFYSVTSEFLQDLTGNTKGGNLNPTKLKNIKALYNEINIYLRDNKNQLDSLRSKALYKEGSLEELSDKGKIKSIAKKIAIFSATIMKFKGENLALSKDLNAGIKSFVDSFTLIQKVPIFKPEGIKKSDRVNDSILSSYDSFIKLLREADGDEDEEDDEDDTQSGKAGELPTGSVSEKIKDFFDKNCKGVRAFTLSKTEADKISQNLENTKIDKFIIDGFDPIIEIIRLFNRAYKIYTTRIISKRSEKITGGTSGPSAGTLMEYTPLGSDGGAPYRHNTTFNIWEDAVFDILGNRDYQVIFDKKTILRVGDEDRTEKGPMLRRFITDMLEGEKLYGKEGGGTDKGTQAKFLAEYFGDTGEVVEKNLEEVTLSDGTDGNGELQKEISDAETDLRMTLFESSVPDPAVGRVFTISITQAVNDSYMTNLIKEANDSATQYTFIITEFKNGVYGLCYFGSFGALNTLFTGMIGNYDVTKSIKEKFTTLITTPATNAGKWKKHYTKVKKEDFKNLFKKGSKIKLNHVEGGNLNTVINGGSFTINNVYWLTKKDKDKNVLFDMNEEALKKAKSQFKDIKWEFISTIPDSSKIQRG